jgi:hypothetical protein
LYKPAKHRIYRLDGCPSDSASRQNLAFAKHRNPGPFSAETAPGHDPEEILFSG